jgi:hypothetical protein
METADDAGKAIRMFNGADLNGRAMNVSEARPQEQRTGGGNRERSGGYNRDSRGGNSGGRDRDRRDRGNRRY